MPQVRLVHTTPQLRCGADILNTFCASHRSITTFFKFKLLNFRQHRDAVTSQFLCTRVQRGNATRLLCSMKGLLVVLLGYTICCCYSDK